MYTAPYCTFIIGSCQKYLTNFLFKQIISYGKRSDAAAPAVDADAVSGIFGKPLPIKIHPSIGKKGLAVGIDGLRFQGRVYQSV